MKAYPHVHATIDWCIFSKVYRHKSCMPMRFREAQNLCVIMGEGFPPSNREWWEWDSCSSSIYHPTAFFAELRIGLRLPIPWVASSVWIRSPPANLSFTVVLFFATSSLLLMFFSSPRPNRPEQQGPCQQHFWDLKGKVQHDRDVRVAGFLLLGKLRRLLFFSINVAMTA